MLTSRGWELSTAFRCTVCVTRDLTVRQIWEGKKNMADVKENVYNCSELFLGAFAKQLRKETVRFVVCLSERNNSVLIDRTWLTTKHISVCSVNICCVTRCSVTKKVLETLCWTIESRLMSDSNNRHFTPMSVSVGGNTSLTSSAVQNKSAYKGCAEHRNTFLVTCVYQKFGPQWRK